MFIPVLAGTLTTVAPFVPLHVLAGHRGLVHVLPAGHAYHHADARRSSWPSS
ncbi:MAG: hypothetical protein WKG07_14735 [Hymenobacter sp.]